MRTLGAPFGIEESRRLVLRGTTLGLLSAGAAWVLASAAHDALPRAGTPARAEDVLTLLVAAAGAAVACWLALAALVCLAALLPGLAGVAARRLAASLTPAALRRVLAVTLTTSVGTVVLPAGPVHADPTGSANATGSTDHAPGVDPAGVSGAGLATSSLGAPVPGFVPTLVAPAPGFVPTTGAAPVHGDAAHKAPAPHAAREAAVAPSPGWRPDRPTRTTDPSRTTLLSPAPRIGSTAFDAVVVHRGDTLWSIAARALGPGATDAEIAHEWPRWYAANRHVIGDDPDLLQPGQSLVPPTAEVSR